MSLLDAFIYPPVGFHFAVILEMFPQTPQDFRFQSVSGLSVDIPTEAVAEGGEHRFKHQFPGIPNYGKLTLKRGFFQGSFIEVWCRNAIENFEFDPKDMIITLLNDLHLPVAVWKVHKAYPVKVSISEFNAEQNTLVIETLELAYQYYQTVDLSSLLPAIVPSISLSASISL